MKMIILFFLTLMILFGCDDTTRGVCQIDGPSNFEYEYYCMDNKLTIMDKDTGEYYLSTNIKGNYYYCDCENGMDWGSL